MTAFFTGLMLGAAIGLCLGLFVAVWMIRSEPRSLPPRAPVLQIVR